MIRIVTIVGARPQFVKAAMVSAALKKKYPKKICEILVHTGQHYDYSMSDLFFKQLEMHKPDYNLAVGSYSQGKQTGRMLEKVEAVLQREKPNLVLVYGDTNSTLAGALAARKLHIPVTHVEAGMRSFNRSMPEEVNRVLVDHMSDILLCSSEIAVKNLKREGIHSKKNGFPLVVNVGDVMVDALKQYAKIANNQSTILNSLNIQPKSYVLATVHRAENTDCSEKLLTIFKAFDQMASDGHNVILPCHPRTQKKLIQYRFKAKSKGFRIIGPTSYLDTLMLQKNAQVLFTDSGGMQKEAYFFKVPTGTLRDETEWVETLESGLNRLVPIREKAIQQSYQQLRSVKGQRIKADVYGTGQAAEKISRCLATTAQ